MAFTPAQRAVATLASLWALGLAGCASHTRPEPPMRLTVTDPADQTVVRSDTVEVRGRVQPATAAVQVMGAPAAVDAGSFSQRVPLHPGTNVIDVLASAQKTRPAAAALRIRRQLTVAVPDVTALAPDRARQRLVAAGLRTTVKDVGGLFDALLPGDVSVCRTEPTQGQQVDAGSVVRLFVAKSC